MSNFCEVLYQGESYRCQLRGKLRLAGGALLTGDRVAMRALEPGRGLIESVLPRSTALVRPPVANVDLCVVVLTTESPPLNLELVDRILLLARAAGLDVLLCINKVDLAHPEETQMVERAYAPTGWPVLAASAKKLINLDRLVDRLAGRVAVMSGQSGVGKSTLLNALAPHLGLETGDLSAKVQRGRHTTRAVQLLRVGAGLVADAPGFVRLELPAIDPRDLAGHYPEMRSRKDSCRFDDCVHDAEPACAVKDAVARGEIDDGRYRRYRDFLHELQSRPKY
jgi:ribosome biogenesis GTPase